VIIHASHFTCKLYKRCRFGFNWSVIKCTLHGEQNNFSAVCPFPLESINWKFIASTFHASAINAVSFVDISQ
jgi:hypothetical protein